MARTPALKTLTRRADFLYIAGHRLNAAAPGLVLQAAPNRDGGSGIFLGFTVSAKVGKAVVRNRVKRRLREAVRAVLPPRAKAGFAYVVIGRRAAQTRSFEDLKRDLEHALDALDRKIK